MATVPLGLGSEPHTGALLVARVTEHGSRSHPYAASATLLRGPGAARNLADAIHFLCMLHGRHPGLVDEAAGHVVQAGARRWLIETADAFARERAFLARLAVGAGPVPATPGTGSEAAMTTQRNAFATLARSERRGCALGAAFAFAADWIAIRAVLDAAADRFQVAATVPPVRSLGEIDAVAQEAGADPAVRRAMLFGAEQVALQHRGLWDLLQARAEARS